MRAKNVQEGSDSARKLKFYGALTALFVLLAIAVTLLPRGNPIQQCSAIILGPSRDSCFYSLATSTQNQSICAMIAGGSAGACYSSVAESTLTPSACQKAGSSIGVSACTTYIAQATNNAQLCSALAAPYMDGCITSLAIKVSSLATCAAEPNSSDLGVCISAVNFDLAASTSLPTYCAQVSNSSDRKTLAAILNLTRGALTGGNSSALSSISSLAFLPSQNISARDVCYTMLAARTSNPAFCANESSSGQGLCAYAVRNYTNATPTSYGELLSSCGQFMQYRGICAQYVLLAEAINTKNVSICAGFQQQFAIQCYSSIAAKYSNATFCGYIRNSTAYNACLLQIK
ncbi:MAG: hypothetical protein KGH54_00265 [Candidatus Micrarchaeota archaeon]|nr:hypothetical protein [Candidatus Micrarchaeota archaeon]